MHVVGFDPGGKKAFGWAVLAATDAGPSLIASGTCDSAPVALSAARAASPTTPVAFGADAPLYWVHSGDRASDKFVRTMVCTAGGSSGTVSHVNSLQGACLVQGILVARLAAAVWPDAAVTEAHPKALLATSSAARDFARVIAGRVNGEHERDAAIAAFSALALAMNLADWHDLAATESNPFFPGGKRVSYWYPRTRT